MTEQAEINQIRNAKLKHSARRNLEGWIEVPDQASPFRYQKPLPHGYSIRVESRRGDWEQPYLDAPVLFDPNGDAIAGGPIWQWADVDRDRLVYQVGGVLWSMHFQSTGPVDLRMIADLNPLNPAHVRGTELPVETAT